MRNIKDAYLYDNDFSTDEDLNDDPTFFLNSSQNIKSKRILNSVTDNNSVKTNVTEENSDNVELSDTESEIEVLKYQKSLSVKMW